MKNEPETYEELIRKKRCIDLTKYYELSEEELEQIYNFLKDNKNGEVRCAQNISLVSENNPTNATIIMSKCMTSSIDGIIMSNQKFTVIPHYTPSSSYSSSGGSSSNNNNNNKKEKRKFKDNINKKYLKNGSYSSVMIVVFVAIIIVINMIVGNLPSKYTQLEYRNQHNYDEKHNCIG